MARFYLNAEPGTDLRVLLEDVKGRVDTITTFPNETERPRVFIPESGNYYEVLSVAVTGNLGAHDLRKVARRVQEDLLEMPGISRAAIEGDRRYEISIEANADKLLSYNLSFQDLADCDPAVLDRHAGRSHRQRERHVRCPDAGAGLLGEGLRQDSDPCGQRCRSPVG